MKCALLMVAFAQSAIHLSLAQNDFQNLDFESATVFDVAPGETQIRLEATSDALPGWTAYFNQNAQERVYHNTGLTVAPAITLYGPAWTNLPPILDGRYSLGLVSGSSSLSTTCAVAQVGRIPISARSIVFRAQSSFALLGVTFAGQRLDVRIIGEDSSNVPIYGVAVAPFAGQTGELRFSSEPYPWGPPVGFALSVIDSIQILTNDTPRLQITQFSNQVILSWELTVPPFMVETSASLAPSASWNTLPTAFWVAQNHFVLTNTMSSGSAFYRLTR